MNTIAQRINRLIKRSLVINFVLLGLWKVNVEFGYGRMKWVHRKTILKHLKIDLYISSNPIQKKSSVKIGKIKLSKKEKPQYQKLKKQKLFIVWRKNRFRDRQNETPLLKNTEKSVYRKKYSTHQVFMATTIVLRFVQTFSEYQVNGVHICTSLLALQTSYFSWLLIYFCCNFMKNFSFLNTWVWFFLLCQFISAF